MKQLSKLAIVCAKRKDALLEVLNGYVRVHVGMGPERETLRADWKDNKKIKNMIYELKFGKFKKTAK